MEKKVNITRSTSILVLKTGTSSSNISVVGKEEQVFFESFMNPNSSTALALPAGNYRVQTDHDDITIEFKKEIEDTIDLELKKMEMTQKFSDLSFQERRRILPDYKLQNALLGVYDQDEKEKYQKLIKAFRDEFYRLKSKVEKAKSRKSLDKIIPNFPEAIEK